LSTSVLVAVNDGIISEVEKVLNRDDLVAVWAASGETHATTEDAALVAPLNAKEESFALGTLVAGHVASPRRPRNHDSGLGLTGGCPGRRGF
jgi:hypothetical protein